MMPLTPREKITRERHDINVRLREYERKKATDALRTEDHIEHARLKGWYEALGWVLGEGV